MEPLGQPIAMRRIGPYSVGRQLGRGGTAECRLANTLDGKLHVLKIFDLSDPDTRARS